VTKHALQEESFEVNIRAYTKIIHYYGNRNLLEDAEIFLTLMKQRGFIYDQVILTTVVHEGCLMKFNWLVSPQVVCSLVVKAYSMAGQAQKTLTAFENMRRASIKPTDKCIASVLVAYEKESKINKALECLLDWEKDGIMVGEAVSAVLAKWFQKLGVVIEVELVLRDFATSQ